MAKFRMICVLDSTQDQGLSSRDVSPDYLHIHALEIDAIESIEEFSKRISVKTDTTGTLVQWGKPAHLYDKKRREKVSASEVKKHGQVGLGSAWRGSEGSDGTGGGEAFLFGEKNVRVTRGSGVFDVADDGKYWIFQVADFSGAEKISDLRGEIKGREALKKALLEKSLGKPFVATFDIEAEDNFYTRSNGIFPEDRADLEHPDKALFIGGEKGGHVVGGSANEGDLKSLSELPDPAGIDFSLKITSDVLLKPLGQVKIVKKDGSCRAPRTETRVRQKAERLESDAKRQQTEGK